MVFLSSAVASLPPSILSTPVPPSLICPLLSLVRIPSPALPCSTSLHLCAIFSSLPSLFVFLSENFLMPFPLEPHFLLFISIRIFLDPSPRFLRPLRFHVPQIMPPPSCPFFYLLQPFYLFLSLPSAFFAFLYFPFPSILFSPLFSLVIALLSTAACLCLNSPFFLMPVRFNLFCCILSPLRPTA